MAADSLLCRCIVVSEREVLRAIRGGARTVVEVGERCDAGTGCGSCHRGIEMLLDLEARRRTQRVARRAGDTQVGLFGTDD